MAEIRTVYLHVVCRGNIVQPVCSLVFYVVYALQKTLKLLSAKRLGYFCFVLLYSSLLWLTWQ